MNSIVGSISGAIIMIVIMAIPILAIITNAQLKKKQLELDKIKIQGISAQDIQILVESIKKLKEENESLRKSFSEIENRLKSIESKN